MPSTEAQVLDAGVADAAHAAEALQQPRALLRADAGDVLEPAAAGAHAGAPGAHAGDGEAVRLVADLRHQHQRRRVGAERDLRPAVGEHQFLQADLAALALLDADDQRQVEAELVEHLARHRHLAAAAVDEHQVGQAGARVAAARAGGRGVAGGIRGVAGAARVASAVGLRRQRGELGVAAHQHLPHRGVVVARVMPSML